MTALRLSVRQSWRVRSAGVRARLSALVGTGLVVGVILALRGREPTEVALAAAFSVVFAALAWIDLERREIPNRLVYPALAAALAASGAWPARGSAEALIGGLCAFVAWAVVSGLSRGGLGGGDVKLATLAGTVVGYPDMIPAALTTTTMGALVTMALVATRRVERTGAVPYGPFISLGAVRMLLH